MATLFARIAGQHGGVLQFHREPVRAPHLSVIHGGSVIEGGGAREAGVSHVRRLRRSPALLVVVATLLAVAVDLVDGAAAWSHWAVLGSLLVLGTHALVTRRRAR